MNRSFKLRIFVAMLTVFMWATWLPSAALAEGTGVDFAPLIDPPPLAPKEARLLAEQEAAYQEWLACQDDSASIEAIDAPYYYLWTPSHKQANGYYCGPATCQIIDDYWGNYVSQATYAAKYSMCPSSNGTVYNVMDDVLRYYTGKTYNYYGGISSSDTFYLKVQYGLETKHYPESVLVRINPTAHEQWEPYEYYHSGHIVCLEAFDWRVDAEGYRTVRFNDPFNEADYYSSGGATYGHHKYPRVTVWYGLDETVSNAMIY